MESGDAFRFDEFNERPDQASGFSPQDASNRSQDDVNAVFAQLVTGEEDFIASGDLRVITRPNGKTETSDNTPDGEQMITLFSSMNMDPEARAKAFAASSAKLREAYGRTEEEHERLRLTVDTAKERYRTAYTEDERARKEEPGSDNQLAALIALENAKDAYAAAINGFCLNDFTPIIKYTPAGKYVNGELAKPTE